MELGSATSGSRTAEQTLVARLWYNVGTPTNFYSVWNNVARQAAVSRNLSTVENARLFALLNIAHHDALQTAFSSKYVYGLWRPVTAIRRADEDGNPDTTQDVNWSSLIAVKSHPSHSGDLAAVAARNQRFSRSFRSRRHAFSKYVEGAGGRHDRTRALRQWQTNKREAACMPELISLLPLAPVNQSGATSPTTFF
jgi:hypothetical protein